MCGRLDILPNITDSLLLILKIIILFFLVYNSCFIKVGSIGILNTERSACLLILLYFLFTQKNVLKFFSCKSIGILKYKIVFQSIILLYSIFLLFINGLGDGKNLIQPILTLLIYLPIFFFLLINIIQDKKDLMTALLYVTLIQSLIIMCAFVNPHFANTLDTSIFNKDLTIGQRNYSELRQAGYPGGVACITSIGTLQLSLGLVSCLFFIINTITSKRCIAYFIAYMFIGSIMTLVARTGLVISLLGILILINFALKNRKTFALIKLLAISVCIVFFILLASGILFELPYIYRRLMAFSNGAISLYFYSYFHANDTYIPFICLETILGTGITSGISGSGIKINVDGNFIRMYAAIGLPLAIVFYGITLFFIKKLINCLSTTIDKHISYFLLIIFIIGEFKEPFFYSKWYWIILFTYVYLSEKQARLEQPNNDNKKTIQ